MVASQGALANAQGLLEERLCLGEIPRLRQYVYLFIQVLRLREYG
jgi:hypothetical protein